MAEAVASVSLADARNRTANNPISHTASRRPVLVLASQEDEQIARHIWALFARIHS
jgi:acetate kinase